MASAAGLPACFLISPTALPLVGSISKRRRSQRKVTFSHFSIGSRPPGFESQNHIAIKKPPQGRFFYGVSGGTSRLFSNFADSAAACRLNKQTAPLTTKNDIQSLFYRFAPSRVRIPKSYCHKKTAARTVFFMASAAGLPACFLISPTALPLVGSISKRRRSQRKVTFSHFSIGSRPLGFESQNHIAIKKPPQGRFFLWRQRRDSNPLPQV